MPGRRPLAPVLLGAAGLLAWGGSALAAGAETPRAEAFQSVLDCRKIGESQARLACYDAAAGRMETAETSGEILVIDKAQATTARRQAFGLNVPSLDFLTRGLKADEADRLDGVVKAASPDAYGAWTMWLEDGARWRQISNEVLSRFPKPGSKVAIRKGALGSYKMNIDGQPAIKVHRDE